MKKRGRKGKRGPKKKKIPIPTTEEAKKNISCLPGDLLEPLTVPDPVDNHNQNWTRNHVVILDALDKYLRQYKRFPSYAALARLTDLEVQTVKNHFDSYDWTRVRKKAQMLTEKLIYEIYENIRKGTARKATVALWFKVINQWRDGYDINLNAQYDFRYLGEKVEASKESGERTRNIITFLSAINGRMGNASLRSN